MTTLQQMIDKCQDWYIQKQDFAETTALEDKMLKVITDQQQAIKGLREALDELLAASIKDAGDPDDHQGDDACVGWDSDGEMALTFATLRRAREALTTYDPETMEV